MKFLHSGKLHQRSSRRGGMLILVLMIFAVSLILISSAMTITLASRNRYYVDAERSQERLTLSCAAETVIDAIKAQEITDEQLLEMANTDGAVKFQITGASSSKVGSNPAANSGFSIAPGLAGMANTSETYFIAKKASGSSNNVILEFSTRLDITGEDSRSENLRVTLKYTPPTQISNICENMVTCGEDGSSNNLPKLEVTTTDSFTVFHGNISLSDQSGAYIHNAAVFTGKAKGGSGTYYYNDIIFYGPQAGIDVSSQGNGIQVADGYEGYMFFLGVQVGDDSSTQNAFQNSSGEGVVCNNGMNIGARGAGKGLQLAGKGLWKGTKLYAKHLE